jgi:hypothetical protein
MEYTESVPLRSFPSKSCTVLLTTECWSLRWFTRNGGLDTDAPAGTVMGNVLVNAFIDSSGSLARVDTHGIEMAELMELELREAYRQRVVPIGCGFVADSIADRLICAGYVRPSDEYWTLLRASIKQTKALLNAAEASHQPFLAAALRMLNLVHSDAVNRLKS